MMRMSKRDLRVNLVISMKKLNKEIIIIKMNSMNFLIDLANILYMFEYMV